MFKQYFFKVNITFTHKCVDAIIVMYTVRHEHIYIYIFFYNIYLCEHTYFQLINLEINIELKRIMLFYVLNLIYIYICITT